MHEEDSRLFWSDTDPQAESTLEELVGGLSPLELHRQDLVTYYAAARVAGRKFLEIEQGIAEQATKIESIANILDDKSVYHNPSFIRELRNLQKTAEEKRLMLDAQLYSQVRRVTMFRPVLEDIANLDLTSGQDPFKT